MEKPLLLFTVISVLLVGCSQEKSYKVWVAATQGNDIIDSAIERLTNAEVDFIIDDNGNVLVNEKDINDAVMCCS